jgi:hypothetical protein
MEGKNGGRIKAQGTLMATMLAQRDNERGKSEEWQEEIEGDNCE